MLEPTATPRHEPGRAAVPVVLVPRVLLVDHRLSTTARGLASITTAHGGSVVLALPYREDLDAVDELVQYGYAVLEGDHLALTPVAGWGA